MKERICEKILIKRKLCKLKNMIASKIDEIKLEDDYWMKKYIEKGSYHITESLYVDPLESYLEIKDERGLTIYLNGELYPTKYKTVGFFRKRKVQVSCACTFNLLCAEINITKKQIFVYYKHLYRILKKIGREAGYKELIKCWKDE